MSNLSSIFKVGDKVRFASNIDQLLVEKAGWDLRDTKSFLNSTSFSNYNGFRNGRVFIITSINPINNNYYYEVNGFRNFFLDWVFEKVEKQLEFDF